MIGRVLSDWRVFAVATIVALIVAVWIGEWLMVPLLLTLAALFAWYMRDHWWPKFREQIQVWRGAFVRVADRAPSYWATPAANEEHAGYRLDYERLVSKPGNLTRAELFLVAEIVDGLQGYGDNPLAAPPTIRQQFAGVGGAMGVALGRWTWIVGALLVGACLALWGWGQSLTAERDAACSVSELQGRTSREPCRDLAEVSAAALELQTELDGLRASQAESVGSQVVQARETQGLNQRRAQRTAAAAERTRRAHEDDLESARASRAPDWDGRLRDVTAPLPLFAPDAGAASGSSGGGGVPDGRAGEADLPQPDASGSPDRPD